METSILTSIKKLLGLSEDNTDFDMDVIIHINSVFSILAQLGAGPEKGFSISDASAVWGDYLCDETLLEMVKSYVYMKVRLLFDPPTASGMLESMSNLTKELEWRILVAMDHS